MLGMISDPARLFPYGWTDGGELAHPCSAFRYVLFCGVARR